MTPSSLALLLNPHPKGHLVYPYANDDHLVDAVGLFAASGLKKGEGVILIVERHHVAPIERYLTSKKINTIELQRSGQLVYSAAEKLLDTLLKSGTVDEDLCKTILGEMMDRAAATVARDGHPGT